VLTKLSPLIPVFTFLFSVMALGQIMIKEFMQNAGNKMKLKFSPVLKKLSPVIKFIPVFFSVMGLGLALADVSTDAVSAHRLCTLPCACEYRGGDVCMPTGGQCEDGVINGTAAWDHCGGRRITYDECSSKATWAVPDTCQCVWDGSAGACTKSRWEGSCADMGPSGSDATEYCRNSPNKSDCDTHRKWPHPDYNGPTLHPYWCGWSVGFILGPSLITNAILLISFLYQMRYQQYFIAAGLPNAANMPRAIACVLIIAMAVLQILPYLGMVLKIMVTWRVFQKVIDEGEDSNALKLVATMANIIFAFAEDIPQITFQVMFYVKTGILFVYIYCFLSLNILL
ncbi:unnamed protein product, partial [Meganyctiphanes norvegica]